MATKIKKKTFLTPISRTKSEAGKNSKLAEQLCARKYETHTGALVIEPKAHDAPPIDRDVPADDNTLQDAEIINLKADVKNLFQMFWLLSKVLDAIHPPDQAARDAIQSIQFELNKCDLCPKP